MVYSRDDEVVGMTCKVTSPKNQLQFQDDSKAVLLKPNQDYRSTQSAFKKMLRNFKNNLFN